MAWSELEMARSHITRWQWRLAHRPMTWCDRARVRKLATRRYRDGGLAPLRYAFVPSPAAAAIACGVGAGVRWLQRHPEVHVPLFGTSLDHAALMRAARETIVAVTAKFEFPPDVGPIVEAVEHVTAAAVMVLPAFARGSARDTETKETAPALAAADGDVERALLDEPLARERQRLRARSPRESEHLHMGYVPDGISTILDTLMTEYFTRAPVETFLGRVLAAWWSRRAGPARMADLVFVSYFWLQRDRATRDIERIYRSACAFHAHADFWIAADFPTLARDEHRRVHRLGGSAVTWRDNLGLAFLHNVRVRRAVSDGRFTLGDILHEPNAEVRRTMIELYERDDRGRFLRDVGADVIHMDCDRLGHRRRLLHMPLAGDEPYVAVEVTNSSPEPDGSYKQYILRVPPTITTCRAAVAWTFDIPEQEYEPDAET